MDAKPHNFTRAFPGLEVVHVFPHFHTLGGVESVLKIHHRYDPQLQVRSDFIIYADKPQAEDPRLHFFSISGQDSLARIGRQMQAASAPLEGRVFVYEMLWPIPFLAPFDTASRRVLVLHGDFPGLNENLPRNGHFLDAIICVNRSVVTQVKTLLPHFDQERIAVVNCPINPPAPPPLDRPFAKPLRLGFSGRLQVEQKRVDLISEFLGKLSARGIDYTLDILGDGPERESLEQNLPRPNCRIHGSKQGAAYWDIIRHWDFILFFSDYEGTPLSLLEAMSQGVLPLYPRLDSGGDLYVQSVRPELLYPRSSLNDAVDAIVSILSLPLEELSRLRQQSARVTEPHSIPVYLEGFFDHISSIVKKERISKSDRRFVHRILANASLDTLTRLGSLRKRVRKSL